MHGDADGIRRRALGRLTRFAYVLTGDRQLAQDLVQDCLLALYRRFGESQPLAAPLAHARKTITHGYASGLRRLSSGELVTDVLSAAASRPRRPGRSVAGAGHAFPPAACGNSRP
jgi:DNA-directed RNA polymerase specialized sigma24 family protein